MQVIKPEDHTILFDSFEKDMNESMSCVLSTDYKRSVDIDGMPAYVDISWPGVKRSKALDLINASLLGYCVAKGYSYFPE